MTLHVGQTTFCLQFESTFRIRFVAESLIGFFRIIWISSAEIYQVNKLNVFDLPVRSVKRYPSTLHMTFSFARSYSKSIVASKFGICANFELRMNVQIRLGFTGDKESRQVSQLVCCTQRLFFFCRHEEHVLTSNKNNTKDT